jgi:hypothetical protein
VVLELAEVAIDLSKEHLLLSELSDSLDAIANAFLAIFNLLEQLKSLLSLRSYQGAIDDKDVNELDNTSLDGGLQGSTDL